MQENILEKPVTSYMHRLFVILDENTNIAHAVRQMNSQKAETILVSSNNRPAGIVTNNDILDQVVMKGEDSDQVFLKSIMSKPLVTIAPQGTVKQALQLMRINQIKRLPVVADGSEIMGLVTQEALANAVRTSVLERTFSRYRSAITEKYKSVIGNLGILLQFSGILLVVPAFIGAALGEDTSAVGILFAVIGLSFTGFFLTHIGEKGPMGLKQASIFIVSSFLLLSLFGSIPYIYLDPFKSGLDTSSLFVDGFFESASGFTTTGLSIMSNPENLPKSLDFYHSYTQWVGGLSFIYLVMVLFYPERKLSAMKSVLGGGMLRVKELLVTIVVIFTAYTVLLIFALVFLSQTDVLDATSLVFSTITSGGFTPNSDIVNPAHAERLAILSVGMILSALPFAFHYYVFTKAGLRTRKTISLEVTVFLLLVTVSIPIFYLLAGGTMNIEVHSFAAITSAAGSKASEDDPSINGSTGTINIFTAAFHIISASTTTGFQYLDVQSVSPAAKAFLIMIMLVGGTAFSTAGGIKVGRFLIIYQEFAKKSKYKTATATATRTKATTTPTSSASSRSSSSTAAITAGSSTSTSISSISNPYRSLESLAALREEYKKEAIEAKIEEQGETTLFSLKRARIILSKKVVREILIVIMLYVSVSFVSALALSFITGFQFEDALFESTSAISTTGLSAGITSLDLDSLSKLILACNMIVGRFEVIAILYIFSSRLRK